MSARCGDEERMMGEATQSRHGPLAGIRVLDFTALVPGPMAGPAGGAAAAGGPR